MIYCISGPPRVGKSTVGRRVAAHLELPCVPTDIIRLALEKATVGEGTASPQEHSGSELGNYTPGVKTQNRFPVSTYRSLVAKHGAEALLDIPIERLIQAYLDEATACWPAIERIIRFYANRQESILLEGCQLRPAQLAELEPTLGDDQLRVVTLVRINQAATDQAIFNGHLNPGWMVDAERTPALVGHYTEFITQLSTRFATEAETGDWPTVSVDDRFDQALIDGETTLLGTTVI